MKKGNSNDNEFMEMNRKVLETNMEAWKEIMDLSLRYSSLWQEYFNAQTQRLSNAKDMSDVVATESGLAAEYSQKFNETNRRLYETITKSLEQQMKGLNMPTDMDIKNMFPFPMDWEGFTTQNKK